MNYLIRKILKIPDKLLREIKAAGEFFYFRILYRKPCLPQSYSQKQLLLCGGEDLKVAAEHFRRLFPRQVEVKIKESDLICAHVFDLLGSGPTNLNKEGEGYGFGYRKPNHCPLTYQPIDWHSDFKSKYRWDPQIFYKRIKYGHVIGVDIKVPWELSRFQHLNTLGQAHILTGDKKYREEFVSQVTDWIESNPIGFGVNWACTMDVAIRAANWLVAKEFFEESALPKEFLEKFYTSIYEHGRFIRNHLEYSPSLTTNHYIADLAGLFFIAVYCPFLKESAAWQKFCVHELEKEIQKQVYDDGCSFEASTSYHRLVLEMFFYCELLARRCHSDLLSVIARKPSKTADEAISRSYSERLHKMFEFSLYCVKPNGKIPQIGDNDNGRYLIFSSRPVLEHKYLLSLAAIYYGDSEFKPSEFSFDEEAFWIFGAQGHTGFEQLPFRAEPLKSRAFPNAGWYIMRHNKDYCFISCGPNGQNGHGGHAHNDKLSLELMLDGEDIIVDPGTYVYTADPEERNKFRSTAYHNTVARNGFEQNSIGQDLFSLKCGIRIEAVSMEEDREKVVFSGSIETSESSLKRQISFDKNQKTFLVRDNFIAKQSNNAISRIHFAPGLEIIDQKIMKSSSGNNLAQIEFQGKSFQKKPYDYSGAYGVKEQAIVIESPAGSYSGMAFKITRGKS